MSVLCFRQHELVGGGNFATLALSRPEVNNALNSELLEAMSACCITLAEDSSCRAVFIYGQGKHFCAGADIKWMRQGVTLIVIKILLRLEASHYV